MEMLTWFCERHPLVVGFIVSLLLMGICDNEVLSSGLGALWALIGAVWFFMKIAEEGIDL